MVFRLLSMFIYILFFFFFNSPSSAFHSDYSRIFSFKSTADTQTTGQSIVQYSNRETERLKPQETYSGPVCCIFTCHMMLQERHFNPKQPKANAIPPIQLPKFMQSSLAIFRLNHRYPKSQRQTHDPTAFSSAPPVPHNTSHRASIAPLLSLP